MLKIPTELYSSPNEWISSLGNGAYETNPDGDVSYNFVNYGYLSDSYGIN